jgi:hypothetical protein
MVMNATQLFGKMLEAMMDVDPAKCEDAYVLGYIDAEDHIPNRATERYTDPSLHESYHRGYRTAARGYPIDKPQ